MCISQALLRVVSSERKERTSRIGILARKNDGRDLNGVRRRKEQGKKQGGGLKGLGATVEKKKYIQVSRCHTFREDLI